MNLYWFCWFYIFWGIKPPEPKPPVKKDGNVYYPDFGAKK